MPHYSWQKGIIAYQLKGALKFPSLQGAPARQLEALELASLLLLEGGKLQVQFFLSQTSTIISQSSTSPSLIDPWKLTALKGVPTS